MVVVVPTGGVVVMRLATLVMRDGRAAVVVCRTTQTHVSHPSTSSRTGCSPPVQLHDTGGQPRGLSVTGSSLRGLFVTESKRGLSVRLSKRGLSVTRLSKRGLSVARAVAAAAIASSRKKVLIAMVLSVALGADR